MAEVALDPVARQVLLQQMRREVRALQARYGAFSEFVQIVRDEIGDGAGDSPVA